MDAITTRDAGAGNKTASACPKPDFRPTPEQRTFLEAVETTLHPPEGWTLATGRTCLLRDWVTLGRLSRTIWTWHLTPAGYDALHDEGDADALTDTGATNRPARLTVDGSA